jgi:tetraacyldisaccharide 4'-kinase
LLAVAAVLFHAARLAKFWSFRAGLFPRTRLRAVTLSVGNLAVGGTGKTPVTRWLARLLTDEFDVSVAVLCRGYGSRNRLPVRVVSLEGRPATDASSGGDEAFLLARALSRATVLAGKRRALTGRAADRLGCRAVLLDDGFQYWRLERDLDLVCFSAAWPLEAYRPFPLGVLREPLSRLAATRFLVISGADSADPGHLEQLRALLTRHAPGASILESHFRVTGLGRPGGELREQGAETLAGQAVLAVSNVADPRPFWRELERLGVRIAARLALPDHHAHRPEELEAMLRQARDGGLQAIVATEKDEQTLAEAMPPAPGCPIWIARGEAELSGPGLPLLRAELVRLLS